MQRSDYNPPCRAARPLHKIIIHFGESGNNKAICGNLTSRLITDRDKFLKIPNACKKCIAALEAKNV